MSEINDLNLLNIPEEGKIICSPEELKDLNKNNKLSSVMYWTRYENQAHQKIAELKDLIPRFKDFYYEKKMESRGKISAMKIIFDFQDYIAPLKFNPSPGQFRLWRKKWDKDILEKMNYADVQIANKREINNAIKLRNEDGMRIVPTEEVLEDGSKTLAGALVNDAMTMLSNDQELDEIFTADELVKRRNYVLNVMAHVTKLVHSKKALDIKTNAEKRETAGFLMDLIKGATSGTMTVNELQMLKDSLIPNKNMQTEQEHSLNVLI